MNVMSTKAEILAVSAAWDAALVANDAEAVASFMTDDWVYVGPTGATPRADIVDGIASGQLAHHSMRPIGRPRVAVHGDTVVVTARKASTGTSNGAAYAADEWISEVYVRASRSWPSPNARSASGRAPRFARLLPPIRAWRSPRSIRWRGPSTRRSSASKASSIRMRDSASFASLPSTRTCSSAKRPFSAGPFSGSRGDREMTGKVLRQLEREGTLERIGRTGL